MQAAANSTGRKLSHLKLPLHLKPWTGDSPLKKKLSLGLKKSGPSPNSL